ncbi:hypothetical protein SAMN05216464_11314 [Mucilaginibacter pineti]|uniref:Plasmid transfer protein n=1 Tax=Mucilaginibacter pineti TaxID=1391627 RepID=A0A1G7IFS2_9SPHI|nr:hypothetical protein [Mucilaginibacter pineti]SDF11557.1 hypothetical protein SAMN05216464_11314 [Mucilaginibacter pineti]
MKRALIMAACLCAGLIFTAHAQVNVVLLHQLVAESESEHERQQEARNKQAVVSTGEEVNRSEMSKLKSTYRTLQKRFQTVGLAITAAGIGLEAIPLVDEIVQQQGLIFQRVGQDPVLVALAYQTEADLSEQAYHLLNYIYGLALSYGDLNQMKASDRKMLFGRVVTELRRIAGASRGLAASLYYAAQDKNKALNPFSQFINQDKQLVDDIMRRIKILKPD